MPVPSSAADTGNDEEIGMFHDRNGGHSTIVEATPALPDRENTDGTTAGAAVAQHVLPMGNDETAASQDLAVSQRIMSQADCVSQDLASSLY